MMTFEAWCRHQDIWDPLDPSHIQAAFEVLVSRIDAAKAAGAADPMLTVSTSKAGPNSRAVTHTMLEALGYSPAQRRIVHRLMAGSTSGWRGLLLLFATDSALTSGERRYVLRHARQLAALRQTVAAGG
jgi:hypothetical protein